MSEWLQTYGVDRDFGLRRTRRIVERAFKRMLGMKYVRFVSRYGVVYLDQYPPSNSFENRNDCDGVESEFTSSTCLSYDVRMLLRVHEASKGSDFITEGLL